MKKKNLAFTLAEVLITLGVIGVVAAFIFPNLIHNYQKFVYKTKWKKAYSDFEKVASQISYDYGVDTFSEALEIVKQQTGQNDKDISTTLLKKYFNYSKVGVDGSSLYDLHKGTPFDCQFVYGKPFSGAKGNSVRYRYLNGQSAGYYITQYVSAGCIRTNNYDIVYRTDSNQAIITIKVSPTDKGGVIGEDIFVLSINNLRKVVPAGSNDFYTGSDYACNKDAIYGGFACSSEYLLEK